MRNSRLIARRVALYETILKDAQTAAERARIIQAIGEVRGRKRDRFERQRRAVKDHSACLMECLSLSAGAKGGAS